MSTCNTNIAPCPLDHTEHQKPTKKNNQPLYSTPGWFLRIPCRHLEKEWQDWMADYYSKPDMYYALFTLLRMVWKFGSFKILDAAAFVYVLTNVMASASLLYIMKKPNTYRKYRSPTIFWGKLARICSMILVITTHSEEYFLNPKIVRLPVWTVIKAATEMPLMFMLELVIQVLPISYALPTAVSMGFVANRYKMRYCKALVAMPPNGLGNMPNLADTYVSLASTLIKYSGSMFALAPDRVGIAMSPAASCWLTTTLSDVMLGCVLPILIIAAIEEYYKLELLALAEQGTPVVPSLKTIIIFNLSMLLVLIPLFVQILLLIAPFLF